MLTTKHAAIIGIDAYESGVTPLHSAVNDARAVASALERDHGYGSPHLLLDGEAGGAAILRLLEETLPAAVDAGGAVVLYYAGHGVAFGDGSEGPEGFLLPQDARLGDHSTWLPMERVRKTLSRLPCKHLLVVLDCCFAGRFRWASSRGSVPVGRPLYDSQYERFLAGTAWQVLTSASHQENAQDEIPGSRNTRDNAMRNSHSPFAAALLKGLGGAADSSRGGHEPDGVITATELHQFIFEELVPPGIPSLQTPGIWPLKPENTGEFLFLVPGREPKTRPDPPLDKGNNPWLGLRAYGGDEASLFFGRERVVEEILGRLLDPSRPPLLAVVGASGMGKSSVVWAGLLPRLKNLSEELAGKPGAWTVACLPRLQGDPRPLLDAAVQELKEVTPDRRKLLFIDQFEELYTQCPDGEIRSGFLRRLRELMSGEDPLKIVITLRSDFEPRLAASAELGELLAAARYLVPGMTSEELRDVIEEPAKLKALYFEPEALVGELVDEVMAMPGELPLLSFALSEMYRKAQLRRRESGAFDRAITRDDYEAAGGVIGALHRRANELYEYETADPARQEIIRRLFLRMVSQEGGRLARRRVEERELKYADANSEEQARVQKVLDDYIAARLLVADEGGYIEPAHDTLVLAWEKLLDWLGASGSQELMRQLWGAASAWEAARQGGSEKEARGLLWNQDPRLPLVQARYLGSSESWRTRLRTRVRGLAGAPAHPGELNKLEREFAARSVARKRSRRYLLAGIAAAVIFALLGAMRYSLDRADEAQRSAENERQAKLTAQDIARVAVAGEWLEKDPTQDALVMLEVAKPNETAYAVQRMVDIFRTQLSEAILRGHEREILSAAFSLDGKHVVTASADGTARVWAADGSGEPVVLRHQGWVRSAAFSLDGKRVVTASDDGTARVWAADGSGEPVVLRHERWVESAAFSPDGKRVVTASDDGTVRVWAADGSGEPVVLRGHKDRVWSVAFSLDGKRVVTASGDKTARVWAADGSGEPVILRGHEDAVSSAAFSPDGWRVVTASEDKTARVWWADGSGEPVVLRGHESRVMSAAFSLDGLRVITASEDKTARVWAVDGSGEPVVLRGHESTVLSATFSPDGRVVTASLDKTARVWESHGFGEPLVLRGHRDMVWSAAFSLDGKRVVTASYDKTARVWAVDGSGEPMILRGHRDRVWSTAFSLDGRRIVTASGDKTVRVWAADGSGEPEVLLGHEDQVVGVAFSPDGRRVVTASHDKTARVWAADGSGELVVLRGHEGKVESAAFSLDGRRTVTASGDKTARVWAADGSSEPVVLRGHKDTVWSAAFSPDGRRVVTASGDKTAWVWAADGSGEPVVLRGHEFAVESAAFSPDGRRVVTASFDWTARVWATDGSGEPVVLRGHEFTVLSAAFSPGGERIVTASADETARVWRADDSSESVVLRGHGSIVYDAAFSPDGRRVVTASEDGTARVWAVGGRLLQAMIREATNACLEPQLRISYLGEPKDEAAATYERCKRCIGPWRRKFDQRSIRAAPDEAWSKWQECMSR
jgi:WD40 repeat protein